VVALTVAGDKAAPGPQARAIDEGEHVAQWSGEQASFASDIDHGAHSVEDHPTHVSSQRCGDQIGTSELVAVDGFAASIEERGRSGG
jgi:hypothetical protein